MDWGVQVEGLNVDVSVGVKAGEEVRVERSYSEKARVRVVRLKRVVRNIIFVVSL